MTTLHWTFLVVAVALLAPAVPLAWDLVRPLTVLDDQPHDEPDELVAFVRQLKAVDIDEHAVRASWDRNRLDATLDHLQREA